MDAFGQTKRKRQNDGRDQGGNRLRRGRVRRRGDKNISEQGHCEEAPGDDTGRKAPRSVYRGRGRARHPPLGNGPRRNTLHALVPPDDRLYCRKTRLVPGDQGRRADHAVQRKEPHCRRAGRQLVPIWRNPLHLRGARLYGMGSDEPGIYQTPFERRDIVHPNRVLRLYRRVARQEDASSPLDAGA